MRVWMPMLKWAQMWVPKLMRKLMQELMPMWEQKLMPMQEPMSMWELTQE
jgi:hypothetical protein